MIVGIDLGTTHSLIGYYGPDGPVLIPNALGELLTPSVVSVAADDTLIIGRAAVDRLVTHPERSVASFKSGIRTSGFLPCASTVSQLEGFVKPFVVDLRHKFDSGRFF